jgi:pyroglutamyl-peptidase
MTTVLLTGFEPFDGADRNNSWDAVELVAGIDGLVTALLPVEYGRASEVLSAAIARHRPDLVIAVGLADNRSAITPERVAINVEDARIPDNSGAQPVDAAVVQSGPDAHLTRLPIKSIVAAVTAAGIPAAVSDSAGTFVCNAVMYRLLHDHPEVMAGFIHVPGAEVVGPERVARALEIAVRTCWRDSSPQAD